MGAATQYTCLVCGYSFTNEESLPAGHELVSTITHVANCTESGDRHYTCEKCGYEYDEDIQPCGHTYEITATEQIDGVTRRTYTCTVCGDSYTQDMGNQYEKVSNYVEYLFRLYKPYMVWVFIATAGVWSIVLGRIDCVLVKSVTRFARNSLECLEAVRALKSYGTSVYFENDRLDTARMNSEMMLYIKGAFAQSEAQSASKRMALSIRMRMEEGVYIQSTAPYGYRIENGVLQVVAEEAEQVRQIYSRNNTAAISKAEKYARRFLSVCPLPLRASNSFYTK